MPGSGFVEMLELFQADDGTDAVLLIGEIGGEAEEAAAGVIVARDPGSIGEAVSCILVD